MNQDMVQIGLEIRTCHDQRTGQAYMMLVNTRADSLAEIATPYTATELMYIKSLVRFLDLKPLIQIETIFVNHPRYAISSMAALQLAGPAQLTKRAASDVLAHLQEQKWIDLSRSTGQYTLTLRALQELDTYLRNQLEQHVLECVACFALVTQGEQCATDGCRGALHTSCRQWHSAQPNRRCPACNTPWHSISIGESE
ncbi:hypothetical protein MYAM1_002145 [Malassezia yamatoensis]|uniref:Non-structural maintenance of chromosomes element 1 homolog n=1 Tax=Malassezia yamatoensis TaxID=253288 RepID=A0AAJ6CJ09_9BASI|nr:hypothetical protein MYAM1_002145 [Malassezia yamatoensis]